MVRSFLANISKLTIRETKLIDGSLVYVDNGSVVPKEDLKSSMSNYDLRQYSSILKLK